jgi:hypothetical protein
VLPQPHPRGQLLKRRKQACDGRLTAQVLHSLLSLLKNEIPQNVKKPSYTLK